MRTKKRFADLESRLNGYQVAHQRADQRLDRIGPALVEALGDTVAEHHGGRTNGITTANEGYMVTVDNDPFTPTATFESMLYANIAPQTWYLLSEADGDFDFMMLEEMEKWTVGAKTGVPVDDMRHVVRAAAVNHA